MKYEYKTVNISTESGLKLAEKLHLQGWKSYKTGIDKLLFERPKPKPAN